MTSRSPHPPDRLANPAPPRIGVLLLHGFTGSPATMLPLAEAIAARGFPTSLPLLPGHGTNLEDLQRASYADFLQSAETACEELARTVDAVVVAGLSMGGALAVELAVRRDDLAGLILVNPFIEPADPSFLGLLEAAMAAGQQTIPSIASDIAQPGSRGQGYDATPLRPLLSLLTGITALAPRLGDLVVPVLLFSSRIDHVVPTSSGDFLCSRVAGPVERVMLERSYHVATLDHDAPELCARSVAFLEKLAGG
ncbi:MAG: alpha/beta fold hydrolase [Thermoplasmata archaeon]|nr:alpha/beta fold hydrolase [Thermoplasmata archaeon]